MQLYFATVGAFSGSAALIAMMKPTDLSDRDNPAGIERLYSARFRTVVDAKIRSACEMTELGVR